MNVFVEEQYKTNNAELDVRATGLSPRVQNIFCDGRVTNPTTVSEDRLQDNTLIDKVLKRKKSL